MEGLDLSSIWKLVMSNTQSSSNSNGSLSNSALTDIATSIVKNMTSSSQSSTKTSSSSSSSSSIDYLAIAQQLMSLYNQYKGSDNKTEAAAASNVKQISDIVGAMGGDKSSMLSAGLNILGKLFGK